MKTEKRPSRRGRMTISQKLLLQGAVLMIVAFGVLLTGAYHAVSLIIRRDSVRYAKTIAGNYADVTAYAYEKAGLPVTPETADEIDRYGDYLLGWYQVDCLFMFTPEPSGEGLRCISLSQKPELTGETASGHMRGRIYPHTPEAEEQKAWEDPDCVTVIETVTGISPVIEAVVPFTDSFGNRILAGAAISLAGIGREIGRAFFTATLFITAVFALLLFTARALIKKYVSRPAAAITRGLSEFISDGERKNVRLDESAPGEFATIAAAFNRMSGEIDSYLEDIRTLTREQDRRRAELDIAAGIQAGFLPPAGAETERLLIASGMTPARDVGGDLYDYVPLGGGKTLLVVADVSGKGIAAALFMAVTLMLMRQYAKLGQSPAEILKNTNGTLAERNPRMLFATAFIALLDENTGSFVYSNAGHNPPCVLSRGAVRELTDGRGTLLGLFPGETFREASDTLLPGETLFMYTDGVTEAVGPAGFFGTERLHAALTDAPGAREALQAVSSAMADFTAGTEPHDDVTMLAVTRKDACTLTVPAETGKFPRIRALLAGRLPKETFPSLCLAAEEIFVNICSYAYGDGGTEKTVTFSLTAGDPVTLRFEDAGRPFNPLENVPGAGDFDPDAEGGLGRLIAFSIADKADYARTDGKNVLTLQKYLSEVPHENTDN